jgi:hypothetical protein
VTAIAADHVPSREVPLERLLGRPVFAMNNQRVGRLEEVRAEKHGAGLIVTEYVLGEAGLLERLHLSVRLLLGRKRRGYVAGWRQLDISNPDRLRLLCPVDELKEA